MTPNRELLKTLSRRSVLAILASAPLCAADAGDSGPVRVDEIQKLVPSLSEASCRQIQAVVNAPAFLGRLPDSDVRSIISREKRTLDELMIDLLPVARLFSRPPISHFRVGVVLLADSGSLYLGANIEVPSNVLGFSVHGEQSASANAFMNGETGIKALAGSSAPCGHCRQFLYELTGAGDLRVVIKGGPGTQLSALLPFPFGPRDLGLNDTPFSNKPYSFTVVSPADRLAALAIAAAKRSYAPYSKSPSGVAVMTRSNRVYSGSYLENAAFNPSLSPLQVAMTGIAMGRSSFEEITGVTLFELEGAPISQVNACKGTLAAIAPRASVRVIRGKMRTS
jgi:cytidine deaminase